LANGQMNEERFESDMQFPTSFETTGILSVAQEGTSAARQPA